VLRPINYKDKSMPAGTTDPRPKRRFQTKRTTGQE